MIEGVLPVGAAVGGAVDGGSEPVFGEVRGEGETDIGEISKRPACVGRLKSRQSLERPAVAVTALSGSIWLRYAG